MNWILMKMSLVANPWLLSWLKMTQSGEQVIVEIDVSIFYVHLS